MGMLEPVMQPPTEDSLKLLVELEPRGRVFWSSVTAALRPPTVPQVQESGLWHDVFIQRRVPWMRFVQSVILHGGAAALIWMLSMAWPRKQTIQVAPAFNRSEVITYSPEEYLPPLDTGRTEPAPQAIGDPVLAKQAILSVPPEATNRTQTIVAPPDIKLERDLPLPNIVAMSTPAPIVPLEATRGTNRVAAPDAAVVPPAPEVQGATRQSRTALSYDVVAPAPEISSTRVRGFGGPDASVVEPPPDLPQNALKRMGSVNIGHAEVVAPAPQLSMAEQRVASGRGSGGQPSGTVQPVAPPPSVGGMSSGSGRLVALGIHPVTPSGPVATPQGNRRGTFAAGPQGRTGAAGTPGIPNGSASANNGSGEVGTNAGHGRGETSLPSGLHVGATASAGTMASEGTRSKDHGSREIASAAGPAATGTGKAATAVPDEKVTEVDRQVFHGKRFYSMVANMPNLNSATGSWVIRYAELKDTQVSGVLTTPDAFEKSDPGYPIELMRSNVQGTVTLYAVIHSDGSVGDIRVLSSPDERLEPFARNALARWKFHPATRDGKAVALEAVVMIPFRAKRSAF